MRTYTLVVSVSHGEPSGKKEFYFICFQFIADKSLARQGLLTVDIILKFVGWMIWRRVYEFT